MHNRILWQIRFLSSLGGTCNNWFSILRNHILFVITRWYFLARFVCQQLLRAHWIHYKIIRLIGYLFDMPFGYCKKVFFSNGVLSLSCNRQQQCQSLNSQRFENFSHFRIVASFILSSCPFIGFLVLLLPSLELLPMFLMLMLCFSLQKYCINCQLGLQVGS